MHKQRSCGNLVAPPGLIRHESYIASMRRTADMCRIRAVRQATIHVSIPPDYNPTSDCIYKADHLRLIYSVLIILMSLYPTGGETGL